MAGSVTSERPATRPAAAEADGVVVAGPVIAIGGAEDKIRDKLILSAFVNLAGGPEARIAILPTASSIDSANRHGAIVRRNWYRVDAMPHLPARRCAGAAMVATSPTSHVHPWPYRPDSEPARTQ